MAELSEEFLKAVVGDAGVGIASWDGAAGAGVATFKTYFADAEADYVAGIIGEELIFPEGGNAVDLERSTKAETGFADGDARKPLADGLESGSRDDSGAVGDGIVWKAIWGVADDDLLVEENAEPFGGVFVGLREGESAGRNIATIFGDGESDGAKVGRVVGSDEVNDGCALGVDPLTIDGVEGPGTVVGESTRGPDDGFWN